MRILILSGGDSPERAVSLRSGACVGHALEGRGHAVRHFDPRRGLPPLGLLHGADAVFLALHGGSGEDGRLQEALEHVGIYHYTGSGPAASALAMQKALAKRTVSAAGVPVADGRVIPAGAPVQCPTPAVLKPLSGGSSLGLLLAEQAHALPRRPFPEAMLAEELLPGREYSVAVLMGRALPIIELRPRDGIFDYAHKYTKGQTEELCPAPIPHTKGALLARLALRAFRALELRDLARIDFKENAAGQPIFLEANTLPGMTEESLFPLAAGVAGVAFPELCERLSAIAAARRIATHP